MGLDLKKMTNSLSSKILPEVKGWWQFKQNTNNPFGDTSGNDNFLIPTGDPSLISDPSLSGGIKLNGSSQWLGTNKPVLNTEASYTVAAWVRVDSSTMNGNLTLNLGKFALTAVSQDSLTHSAFYLGIRQVKEEKSESTLKPSLRWHFTISPIDGSQTGPVEWQHAYTKTPLDNSILDKWFLLVGVCDVSTRTANIYVPNVDESGTVHFPNELIFLRSEGGLQIGRGRWLGRNVDQWPGSVGPVKVFSGVLTAEEAKKLYTEGKNI